MKIGFVGLGMMGRGMAATLQKAGFDLVVNDLSRQAASQHLQNGATWAATPREVAEACDIVFTSLPTPADVEAVGFGENGLAAGFRKGTSWFDLSTNAVDVVRRLHGRLATQGVDFLDAPVSGGPSGAASGKLAIWVGGDKAVFDRCERILGAMSDQLRYIGPIGAGSIAKLTHNCAHATLHAMYAEVFTMGVKAGLPPLDLWEAIRQGATGRQRTFEVLGARFLPGMFDKPNFQLRLVHKDVALGMQLGRETSVPMRMTNMVLDDLTEALNRGWGGRDSKSVMALQTERAGIPPIAVPMEQVDAVWAKDGSRPAIAEVPKAQPAENPQSPAPRQPGVKIGFIGLGLMGRGMAANLQKAGFDLVVNDLSRQAASQHLQNGATWAATPRDVAEACDVVFTSLPTPADVEAVGFGENGLAAGFREGAAWFDLSTNAVDVVRRLHATLASQGVDFLDAPVSGGPAGAASGKLAILVGGNKATYERWEAALTAIADQARYIGSIGAGSVAKLTHNCASTALAVVLAEVFTVGVKAGVEPLPLWEAIRQGGLGRIRTFDMMGTRFLPGVFDPPHFQLRLLYKDMALALQLGREVNVPMRLCNLAFQEITEAMNRGWGGRDSFSYMLLQQERSGIPLIAVPIERIKEIQAQG